MKKFVIIAAAIAGVIAANIVADEITRSIKRKKTVKKDVKHAHHMGAYQYLCIQLANVQVVCEVIPDHPVINRHLQQAEKALLQFYTTSSIDDYNIVMAEVGAIHNLFHKCAKTQKV